MCAGSEKPRRVMAEYLDLFLTYEQDAAAIFGFDRNIAYDGKKVRECRVFTGTKLFHLFVVQNRVD